MRPRHEYEEVQRWLAWGLNDCEISRLTNIPRGTIRDWRHGGPSEGHLAATRSQSTCPRCGDLPLDEASYAYLLGMYLGDGHIARQRRIYSLRISPDARYQQIIAECRIAMETLRGRDAHAICVDYGGWVVLSLGWNHWPCAFPQHGSGKKHKRLIRLMRWQQDIADKHPGLLLRGLIHSDGWRGNNRVTVRGKKYVYPRYQFVNYSEDIQKIFCRACDVYGIQWRQMKWNAISVARKVDVAKLDLVVGPKK